jgi:hypothetical protein
LDDAFLNLIKANDAGFEIKDNTDIPDVEEEFIMFDENVVESEDEIDYM